MNPMAQALKSRRLDSAKPAMQDQLSGPPKPDGSGDKLQMLVATLGKDEKAKLLEMLQSDSGESESEGSEGESKLHEDLEGEGVGGMQDKAGQTKNTPGEIEALKAEAQALFKKGQANPLGDGMNEGEQPRSLGDRMKSAINKHFKK